MKKLTEKEEKEQAEYEAGIVEMMTKAHEIAGKLFGARSNVFGVHEIYEYLNNCDNEDDEAELATDLKQALGYAKIAHKTEEPTPEQVFGLFKRIYDNG